MLALLRTRLTYANVVATLALFVALGGSAYAVTQITSKQVKNRSLRGVDIRKNALTGKEIRESKLGRVRSARSALNAATAAQAGIAGIASDAQALAGQSAASFEKSSRTQFARASFNPASSSGEAVLIEWPDLGVQIKSSSRDCGGEVPVEVQNTRTSGPRVQVVGDGASADVPPGGNSDFCSDGDNYFEGGAGDSSGRTLFFRCTGPIEGEIRCVATRSEP